MSELSETPDAGDPDHGGVQSDDELLGDGSTNRSLGGALSGDGGDAQAPDGPDAPRETSPSPIGSARDAQRAVWPIVAAWRTPLVAPEPLPMPPGASVRVSGPRSRSWIAVAVVAALVGAGTSWIARPGPSSALITIRQGTALPGAAILASGTPIPRLVDAVSPSVVSVDVTTGFGGDEGTGMIISADGLVVTNDHVVAALTTAGGGTITVTRTGARTALPATLLGTSPRYDVALLQIQNASGLPAITFGLSSKLVVGDGVVAIGNALGLAAGTPTVTSGIVSALGRTVSASNAQSGQSETLYGMIQTDAAINPGNSGGPLIDSSGQVVGMNTAVAGATSDGGTAQNIGFAIPAARIVHLLPSLVRMHLPTTTTRKGAFLGVGIVSNSSALAKRYHLSVSTGAYIVSVKPGYPAQRAGIQAGDVIVSIDGTVVASDTGVSRIMSRVKPGTTVKVIVERGRSQVIAFVTSVAPPGA